MRKLLVVNDVGKILNICTYTYSDFKFSEARHRPANSVLRFRDSAQARRFVHFYFRRYRAATLEARDTAIRPIVPSEC